MTNFTVRWHAARTSNLYRIAQSLRIFALSPAQSKLTYYREVCRWDVWLWPLADIPTGIIRVRFRGQICHRARCSDGAFTADPASATVPNYQNRFVCSESHGRRRVIGLV